MAIVPERLIATCRQMRHLKPQARSGKLRVFFSLLFHGEISISQTNDPLHILTDFFEDPSLTLPLMARFNDKMSGENAKSTKIPFVARPATVDPADPSRAKVFLFGLDENEERFVFLRSCKDSRVLKSI